MKKKIIALVSVVALVAGIAVLPINSVINHRKAGNVAKEAVVQTAAVKEEAAATEITEKVEDETEAPYVAEETEAVVQDTTAAENTTAAVKAGATEKSSVVETTTAAKKKNYIKYARNTANTEKAEETTSAVESVATTVVEKLGKKVSADSAKSNSSDCCILKPKDKVSTPYKIDTKTGDSQLVEGLKRVKSWTANSDGSTVYVEKIDVTERILAKLSDSEKEGTASNYYAYIAKITTSPDKIQMRDSSITFNQKRGYYEAPAAQIAEETGALIAVNNEMCVHNRYDTTVYLNASDDSDKGTVIKNGILVQEKEELLVKPSPSLVWYENGTWQYPVTVSADNADSLIANGIKNTVSYTYPVIWRGEKYVLPDTGKISNIWNDYAVWHSYNGKNGFDHTLIGKIDEKNYVFGVTEGFGQAYLWDIFYEGFSDGSSVKDGFWCNGGHCSVLYLKGCGAINGGSESSVDRHIDPTPCISADIVGVY